MRDFLYQCEKCFHYEACKNCFDIANSLLGEDVSISDCDHFKDKSLIAELRLGKWLINSDGYYPYCSECGNEPPGRTMTDYCPHCGVKMN